MAIRDLVQLQRAAFDSRLTGLRQVCEPVVEFGVDLRALADDLTDTLMAHRIAVGLAAPQIGVQRQVAVVNIAKAKAGPTLLIVNPRIIAVSGKKDRKRESCMSLPHYGAEVERRWKLHVSYQDQQGNERELRADGFLARVLAHEIDHLEGRLYVDRLDDWSQIEEVDIFRDEQGSAASERPNMVVPRGC